MASNLEIYKKDLDKLMDKASELSCALMSEAIKKDRSLDITYEDIKEKLIKAGKVSGEKEATTFINNLPKFNFEYQTWYSEALRVIQQLLPDRFNDFAAFYDKPKGRKHVNNENYVLQDYLLEFMQINNYTGVVTGPATAIVKFQQQIFILEACYQRFKSSLFNIRQLVQADLFDNELEAARELLKNKFFRAAGVIAGVVLEKHLHEVCGSHSIKINKKDPTISFLNDLLKDHVIIDVPQWRYISMLGDIRNLCSHNKKQEPTFDQVEDLINGTQKVIKTVF